MKTKQLPKIFVFITSFVALVSLLANLFLFRKVQTSKKKDTFIVTNVFDGDTFYLSNNQKVRLLNCNAPEQGFCGAEQSKKRLEELILGKKVTLDMATTDQFGRSVALVYQGKQLINKTMTQEGWVVYEGRKFPGSDEFVSLAQKARAEGKGIYNKDCYQKENIQNPQCLIKANVSRDNGEKFYHFPGCSSYSLIIVEKFFGEDWFCSEKEAQKAGFKKSSNCYGKEYNPDTPASDLEFLIN